RAPEACSARTAASPLRASPSTPTDRPWSSGSWIIASPQLQGGETDQRQDRGDDPEPDHDRRLLPPFLLEVMVQRRHAEHAPAGELERADLNDDRARLQNE